MKYSKFCNYCYAVLTNEENEAQRSDMNRNLVLEQRYNRIYVP